MKVSREILTKVLLPQHLKQKNLTENNNKTHLNAIKAVESFESMWQVLNHSALKPARRQKHLLRMVPIRPHNDDNKEQ